MPSISTHILDTDRGLPARGVRVELYRGERLLSAQQTNDDGRIADLVQGTLETGSYRLVFLVPSPFFS
ncbi:MAG: hydroxyisourate hydrolase, partial [Armatimonadetes bacterium]|nr:hydroxyisourate hydrolase [Armatimonadota bacterium]